LDDGVGRHSWQKSSGRFLAFGALQFRSLYVLI
jgi:hypothetical protein